MSGDYYAIELSDKPESRRLRFGLPLAVPFTFTGEKTSGLSPVFPDEETSRLSPVFPCTCAHGVKSPSSGLRRARDLPGADFGDVGRRGG